MTGFRTLDDIGDVTGKRVLVRVDLNVPMSDGAVADATRIRAAMPTIRELSAKGAIVLLLAHFGRPKGSNNPTHALSPVIDGVRYVLGQNRERAVRGTSVAVRLDIGCNGITKHTKPN